MSEAAKEVNMDQTSSRTWMFLKTVVKFHGRQVLIAVVAALLCMVALWLLLRPRYVSVLSGTDTGTLTQVQHELQTLNIPSRIAGTSLVVPAPDINRLVQTTVQGIQPAGGNLAAGTAGGGQSGAGAVNSSMQGLPASEVVLTQGLEQQISKQLTSGLDQILGPGNAVVMVHANVTFDQVKTTSQVSHPVTGQKNSTERTYVDTQKVSDPMQVHGYTVGVILNADDNRVTPETLVQIQSFVRNAVGISAGSGAQNDISVISIPFNRYGAAVFSWLGNPWVDFGLILVLLTVGTAVVIRLRRQRFIRGANASSTATGNWSETEGSQLEHELAELAVQRPDEFAKVLRTWLTE